jgi:hypothetical protein
MNIPPKSREDHGWRKIRIPYDTMIACRSEQQFLSDAQAGMERAVANAHLMAAAPDLLTALKTAKWMLERDYIDQHKLEVIEKCEAAIAKATETAA